MSQGNGKGGAKRRKSKRGGAGGDHSGVSSVRECPEAEPCGAQAAAMVAPVATEAACVSECVGGAAAAGGPPEASDLGETQSSPPGSTVDSCVLCRAERRDSSFLESGIEAARRLGLSMAPAGGAPPQPLWVCLHCQWTLEKLRIYGGLDQSAQGQDFLVRGPLTAVLPAPPCSGTQGLDTQPPPSDMPRALEICDEPEEISIETDRDSQQLQNYWSELRYVVRCVYRQAGIPLVPEKEWAKELVDRLCMSDPSQLYQRLDQQARDYLLEMKIGLLRQLSAPCRVGGPTCLQSPMQAYQFIALLLKEYSTLCRAARTISTFLGTLEDKHLNVFQVTWELHNKHLFENLVFSEPLLQSHLPALVSQLRVGTTMHDSCSREVYSALLHRFLHLEEELRRVARQWLECQKRVSVYINEKMTMKNKLTKDLRQLTDRQSQEEELTDRRAGTGDALTDAMRHVLSSPICTPRCTHSRVMGPPSPINPHVHQLPFQVGSTPDSLSESHLPSVSLTSLVSGSGSPITTQQHPRLLGTGSVSRPTLCSEDDVASLSAKFADMYPSNDNTEAASNTRSNALGDPASLFLGRSTRNLPASYSPDHEGQGCKKGTSDPQQEGRDKSADKDNCSEHGSATSASSCACTCTYAGQKEGKYCDYCCEFFRHNWLSSAPRGRNYEDMREKLRFRLAKRKEEQSKKTDEVSEQESAGASASASASAVDHRPVEDLLQFINSSEAKPASSTRAAKRARHKQKKLEEKARHEAEASAREQAHLLKEQRQQEQRQREQAAEQLTEEFQQLQKQPAVRRKERPGKDSPRTEAPGGNLRAETRYVPDSAQVRSGSLEQTEEPKTSSDPPSRQAADTGLGAHGDSKLVLPKEVSGKQREPLPFLLHGKHPHKEGAGKQKPKQAWKASSEPRKGPVECPRPSEGQPSPQPQTEPKAKVAGLTSPPEQKRKEKKANRNNNNRKQPSQGKEGKASPGATEPTGPSEETPSSKPMRADAPEPSGKSKKNKKKKGDGDRDGDGDGDGDDSSLEDIFMPKDIDLESVDMDETEREVESFKRFCLESARQTRPRLSIDWSNFSLKKPPFRP